MTLCIWNTLESNVEENRGDLKIKRHLVRKSTSVNTDGLLRCYEKHRPLQNLHKTFKLIQYSHIRELIDGENPITYENIIFTPPKQKMQWPHSRDELKWLLTFLFSKYQTSMLLSSLEIQHITPLLNHWEAYRQLS